MHEMQLLPQLLWVRPYQSKRKPVGVAHPLLDAWGHPDALCWLQTAIIVIALVCHQVLQGIMVCPLYLPLSYWKCICLLPSNLQCSNKIFSFALFFLLLSASRYPGSGLIFSVALFPPSVSLLQQYTAVSQFWNTLVKAGSLLTVWQLRFSWASNKEQVIVPRITQWEYCSFLADNNAIHTVDPWLDNILIDHCHLSGNCLSAPI